MHTRNTHDYSPLLPGSKQEQAAINARREMIKVIATTPPQKNVRRKTWEQRMERKAKGFEIRS